MKKLCIENGMLLWENEEALTKEIAAAGNFTDCNGKAFIGCDKRTGEGIIAFQTKDEQLVVMRSVEYCGHIPHVGVIYQRGSNYFLWLYDDEVETPLGSWREKNFFLRMENNQKIVFNYKTAIEFPFLSLKKRNGDRTFSFQVEADKYRLFDPYTGREYGLSYVRLFENNERCNILHRQEDGTYRIIANISTNDAYFINAYLRRDGEEWTLFGFDGDEVKKLHTAPKDDWSFNLSRILCGNLRWKREPGEALLSFEPEELEFRPESEPAKTAKWWQFWKK